MTVKKTQLTYLGSDRKPLYFHEFLEPIGRVQFFIYPRESFKIWSPLRYWYVLLGRGRHGGMCHPYGPPSDANRDRHDFKKFDPTIPLHNGAKSRLQSPFISNPMFLDCPIKYCKVASTNTSCFETYPGFFKLFIRGNSLEKKLISYI